MFYMELYRTMNDLINYVELSVIVAIMVIGCYVMVRVMRWIDKKTKIK